MTMTCSQSEKVLGFVEICSSSTMSWQRVSADHTMKLKCRPSQSGLRMEHFGARIFLWKKSCSEGSAFRSNLDPFNFWPFSSLLYAQSFECCWAPKLKPRNSSGPSCTSALLRSASCTRKNDAQREARLQCN